MPVPRRRHCPSRKNRRRHQHGMTAVSAIQRCPDCDALVKPHRVCPKCGKYKGRHYGKVKPVTAD